MNIVTLTSDRKSNDFLIGRVKGELYRICPQVNIVDLAHDIPSFSVLYTAFVVKNSYSYFPKNTVHLIGVDNEENSKQKHIVAEVYDQYFVCADNGIITLIFDKHEISNVYTPREPKPENMANFIHFAHIAKDIISSEDKNTVLEPVENFVKKRNSQPVENSNSIIGKIVYVDSYQNAITNIDKSLFENVQKNRPFTIYIRSMKEQIKQISKTYNEVKEGSLIALFNSMGLLKIAICKGKIMSLMDLKIHTEIIIEFDDQEPSLLKSVK